MVAMAVAALGLGPGCTHVVTEKRKVPRYEYVRRQVWATFLDDVVGAASIETHGADTFMWGSDFPHSDSTWPDSQAVIERNLSGVPESIAKKLVHDNAAALYGID